MNNKECRFIAEQKMNGYYNMALDEALLSGAKESKKDLSVFRIYTWDKQYTTIGYFQKYSEIQPVIEPLIRRLTGGLMVVHKNDISYSFITDSSAWPYVYDQESSYKLIHSAIKDALGSLGINSGYIKEGSSSAKNTICVDTMFSYDLQYEGKKIVGSCQRRSGKHLLQQGSIHLTNKLNFEAFKEKIKLELPKVLDMNFVDSSVTKREKELTEMLVKTKYSTKTWNQKF